MRMGPGWPILQYTEADNYDYLGEKETEEGMAIAFPVIDQDNNWASKLPWTVVDKGDTRVSLTLIDTPESYIKVFHIILRS